MTTLANPRSLWDTLPVEIAKIITDLAAAPIILIQRMFRGAAVRRRAAPFPGSAYINSASNLIRALRWMSGGVSSIDPQGRRMDWVRGMYGDRMRTPRYLGYTREQRGKIFWADL